MKAKGRSMVDWALSYAEKGWPVLPLYGIKNGECTCRDKQNCNRAGKHPRVKNGVKNANTNKNIIKKWWKQWPDANIGIATGKRSGLVVFDVDPAHGGKKSLDNLVSKYGVFNTLTQKTGGGGWHYLFEFPDGIDFIKNSAGKIGDGLDVRGDEGYIVACPSVHKSGDKYHLDIDKPLAPIPGWLLGIISKPRSKNNGEKEFENGCVLEGRRNNYLASHGGKLINKGLKGKKLQIALLEQNRRCCVPPLPDDEVTNIARSVSRYGENGKPLLFIWREMIRSSDGPESSTMRWVLSALSFHMNREGGSCYPTISQLCEETSLSKRVVGKYLKEASDDGWLEIYEHQGKGQAWKNHGYIARLPKKVVTESNIVEMKVVTEGNSV